MAASGRCGFVFHLFLMSSNGNNNNKRRLVQSSLMSAFSSETSPTSDGPLHKKAQSMRIFCDLDGVLVDFDRGVKAVTGHYPRDCSPSVMWRSIANADNFFANLEWTNDGAKLWNVLVQSNHPVDILTGTPTNRNASQQKFAWCQRELCVEVVHVDMAAPKGRHERVYHENDTTIRNKTTDQKAITRVITCHSKNKHMEGGSNRILIDDRVKLRDAWETAGGTFVHHTSTSATINKLRRLGIIKDNTKILDHAAGERSVTTKPMMDLETEPSDTATLNR